MPEAIKSLVVTTVAAACAAAASCAFAADRSGRDGADAGGQGGHFSGQSHSKSNKCAEGGDMNAMDYGANCTASPVDYR